MDLNAATVRSMYEYELWLSVPQRGAAAAVLQAHVVVGAAAQTRLVLHSLVPHAHAAQRAATDAFALQAPRPGPHPDTVHPLASHGGAAH